MTKPLHNHQGSHFLQVAMHSSLHSGRSGVEIQCYAFKIFKAHWTRGSEREKDAIRVLVLAFLEDNRKQAEGPGGHRLVVLGGQLYLAPKTTSGL